MARCCGLVCMLLLIPCLGQMQLTWSDNWPTALRKEAMLCGGTKRFAAVFSRQGEKIFPTHQHNLIRQLSRIMKKIGLGHFVLSYYNPNSK